MVGLDQEGEVAVEVQPFHQVVVVEVAVVVLPFHQVVEEVAVAEEHLSHAAVVVVVEEGEALDVMEAQTLQAACRPLLSARK